MSTVEEFDLLIDGLGKIAALAHYRDLMREANATDARQCGNCVFWMKSRECPKEIPNGRGGYSGPSSGTAACDKFQIKAWVVDLKAVRLEEARQFAIREGLIKEGTDA